MKDEQASGTALLIAASLVLMSGDPHYLDAVPAASADLCAQFLRTAGLQSFLKIAHRPSVRVIVRIMERLTIPGILRHYALRKKCIAQLAREELTNGVEQVVVLGAGFDPLGVMLHREFPEARIWEIDHPNTQRYKQAALTDIDPTRFRFVSADLSVQKLDPVALTQTDFSSRRQTLWIAEGLLMYLQPHVVRELFQSIGNLSASGSRFVFTFMEQASDRSIRFRRQSKIVNWWLKQRGEPFRWGTTPTQLTDFLRPWIMDRCFDENHLRKLGSITQKTPLAEGELICLAELL